MLACTHWRGVLPAGSYVMPCPECEYENTEGAWLCINCGAKLPRPETEAHDDAEHEHQHEAGTEAADEEPNRLAPQISANLRRLRDQAEHDRGQITQSALSGNFLGIPLVAWGLVALVIIIFIALVSSLQ